MPQAPDGELGIRDVFDVCLERIMPSSLVRGAVERPGCACAVNCGLSCALPCVSLRYAQAGYGIVKEGTYWDCWEAILHWLRGQMDSGSTSE